MRTKLKLLSIALFILTSCKPQEKNQDIVQNNVGNDTITTETVITSSASTENNKTIEDLPKVKNNLKGEFDYKENELELSINQVDGKTMSVGKITKDGTIHFKMPLFDLKAIHDKINLGTASLTSMFEMGYCKDKDVLKNPYDNEIYSHKYQTIFIRKYGIALAALYPVSSQKVIQNNHYNADTLTLGSEYYWFYMDRAIDFKYECESNNITRTANMHLKKGWNFIKENLVEIQDETVMEGYHSYMPKKITFATSNYKNPETQWYLKQMASDDDIRIVKKLYNETPISKHQFEQWTPKKLIDLSLTKSEYGNPPKGLKNKNNIYLIYANEAQKRDIELYVVDCAKNAIDLLTVNEIYAMEASFGEDKENPPKPYVAQYKEKENTTKLLYKVNDRIVINATGANMKPLELWKYIQKFEVQKLINK